MKIIFSVENMILAGPRIRPPVELDRIRIFVITKDPISLNKLFRTYFSQKLARQNLLKNYQGLDPQHCPIVNDLEQSMHLGLKFCLLNKYIFQDDL
jgi:hypothetical protein